MEAMKIIFIITILFIFATKCNRNFVPYDIATNVKPEIIYKVKPIFAENRYNDLIDVNLHIADTNLQIEVKEIIISFKEESTLSSLSSVYVKNIINDKEHIIYDFFDTTASISKFVKLSGSRMIKNGDNKFIIGFTPQKFVNLIGTVEIEYISIVFDGNYEIKIDSGLPIIRFAKIVRRAGQDDVDTYRIPGIITTKKGTLIAVYDVRYKSSRDLQGDIDIGMSRSTDGGQTWEPMRIILDMNNWGGKPEEENGVGDPSILVDDITGTIWLAALWIHGFPGQIAWNASGKGIEPDVTGQLVMVKSEDDGLSWSEVMNITPQVKDPGWKLMFQGPGRGITLNDGTLVFPAQFKDAEGIPWSTIIYSKDHGITWNIGTGAKPNTTEAQCVQLTDGSIMLNMRDNRNATIKDDSNGRAVAITRDLGKTWETHPSSNNALPEPVCMASIISADLDIGGNTKKVLFFSNPANKYERKNITIKASLDEGLTWSEAYQLEIYRPESFGYSCLTMVDKNTIGILYEDKKDLYFQKILVIDILKTKK